jgi:predicted kinase
MRDGCSSPLLVIVSGAPGSGKTKLARRLGAALRLPLLLKDDLKEALYEALGADDREQSRQLGRAAYDLLALIAGRLLEAGVDVLVESNFRRGLSEAFLAPLLPAARVVLIHCEGDPAFIACRYRERAERGERHPAHFDLGIVSRLQEELAAGVYEPLELDATTLRVDTTTAHEYAPDFEEIVAFVRRVGWT